MVYIAVLCWFSSVAPGATPEPDVQTTHEARWWVGYMSQWRWHPHWSFWFDAHYDQGRFAVARAGISRHLDAGPVTTAGYAHLLTNPGNGTLTRQEFRPWAQVSLPWALGERWAFSQRLRSDLRFRQPVADGEVVTGHLDVTLRMRFSSSFVRYLTRGPQRWFVQIYDEVLVDFGPDAPANRLNQNRLAGLIGWKTERLTLRVGYMDRFLPGGDGRSPRHEHTALFWMNHRVRLGRARRTAPARAEELIEGPQ